VLTTYTIAANTKLSRLSIHSRQHHRNIVATQVSPLKTRTIKDFIILCASGGKRFDVSRDGWLNISLQQFLEMSRRSFACTSEGRYNIILLLS
jgi:hypothetical protein